MSVFSRIFAAATIGVTLAGAARGQNITVKAGVTVAPDTGIKVGDPFHVVVGIRAPKGATIEFPRAMDSTSTIQSLDPVAVRTSPDTSATEQYGDYRVAAWDVDSQVVKLPDVIVRLDGAERHVAVSGSRVFVVSVLPKDSTQQRDPKPPRPLFEINMFPWWLWALIAAAVLALGLLIWWLWRRRRRPQAQTELDAYKRAVAEFTRIDALGLVEAGERGRYVALTVEVLRDYLAARYSQAALSLTSTELTRSVRELPNVPGDRLTRLLTEADLIKFARRPVSGDRAREIARDARAIVDAEHEASQPVPEQKVAA
ncbi:MAG TPA: DUF4381 family protein [Gemmatimonadaceae bacterium]|jgi:hypothetical protein